MFAGGLRISPCGSGRSSGSRSARPRSAGNCDLWVIASSRRALATTLRTLRRWRLLKSLPVTLEAIRAGLPKGIPYAPWWQEESRVGQLRWIARRWAHGYPASARRSQPTGPYGSSCIGPHHCKRARRCSLRLVLHDPALTDVCAYPGSSKPSGHADRQGLSTRHDLFAATATARALPARAPELTRSKYLAFSAHWLSPQWASKRNRMLAAVRCRQRNTHAARAGSCRCQSHLHPSQPTKGPGCGERCKIEQRSLTSS